ncbi:MAG: aspartate aminotransferase family protein [Candidatus Tectomicrobia bacterium]|uniref:Aspartate aminotransferase family protein n=1 Tax=Tectimicrobiota bacterium TaxID=2528274 RepID=A0A932HXT1_UNCTE|nr:aspartate aminotransferase family protein [Candidatus Tectomicrobia bacterium]
MTEAFERKRLASKALFERAKGTIAGGITSELRAAEPFPIFIERAEGSRKWDVDGNEYVDYCMGSAALLLGHAHPAVVKAVSDQAAKGTLYSALTELELRWADLVRELYPSAERVRFVGTGTEANILALRLARAFAGKPKVLRFEGHFHGWGDDTAVGVKIPWNEPPTHGLPPGVREATVVCPAESGAAARALEQDSAIGAIILEPSGASWGTVPLPAGFLKDLRALADKHRVPLIFDEVITGFRWSPGGAQASEGVKPDLTTLAKNLTGGLPGGAVAGREEILSLLDTSREYKGKKAGVFHRGTFNANPISAAAGVAALEIFRTGEPQRHADRLAARLREGMQRILRKSEVAGAVYGDSSTFHIFLGKGARGTIEGLSPVDLKGIPPRTVNALQRALRQRGVDLLSYTGGVTSSAHTDKDIEITLCAFDETVQELAEGRAIERL